MGGRSRDRLGARGPGAATTGTGGEIRGADPQTPSVWRGRPSSHLLRGILYAGAGVLDDAAREFAALRAQNPTSPFAQQLIDQLASARRPAK